MGKATIIEAQNSNTTFEQGKTSGILGKLKGIFADYMHGTRNSDRLYTEELWDKRVFGSEDVMEALETRTLFGELDHPQGDRCETLAKNAAISITKLEKRPDEGVIYGEADILDTPTGRIVKALADSGAKLGISSRGMGEEIYENGQNIIDPDTYDFITFDVVVTPANTKARVSLTESKHINMLTESIKKEINECETANQLDQIHQVVTLVNQPELNTLIENKKDIVAVSKTKLSEANKSIAIKLLKDKIASNKAELQEQSNTLAQLSNENSKLIEENEFYKQSRLGLRTKLKENNKLNDEANSKIEELNNTIKNLQTKLDESAKLYANNLETKQKEYEAKKELLNNQIKALTESNNKKSELLQNTNKLLENLKTQNVKLGKIAAEKEIVLNENKELQNKINTLEQDKINTTNKLTESKTIQTNQINMLKQQIDNLTNKLDICEQEKVKIQEANDKFSKLSFNPIGTVTMVAENINNNTYSTEDIELFNALTNK